MMQNTGAEGVSPQEGQRRRSRRKMVLCVAAVVVVLAAVLGAAVYLNATTFDRLVGKMLKEYAYTDNARAPDGSYLKIDTNPRDKDTDDFSDLDAHIQEDSLNGIKFVNHELGFTDALYAKMLETTALMGRQTDENAKYRVSWSYHPDHGLEVMYEKK